MKITKGELQEGRFLVPYRVYGGGDRVLVCVSGAQQTMAVWRSFSSYFCKNYSVVVFDSPGQGRSQILSGSSTISLDEQVTALHSIISTIHGYGPVYLAAASWGTIVAAAYAARYPTVVEKLILGSFGVKPSQTMLEVIQEGRRLYNENRAPDIGYMMIERFGQQIPDAYKKRIVEQFRHMSQRQLDSFYAHCDMVENGRHISRFVDLQNIKAYTLIVNGDNDTILDLEDAGYASSQIQNCEVRIVPGAGHFLHFEQGDILDIYDEFLSRQYSSKGSPSPVLETSARTSSRPLTHS